MPCFQTRISSHGQRGRKSGGFKKSLNSGLLTLDFIY